MKLKDLLKAKEVDFMTLKKESGDPMYPKSGKSWQLAFRKKMKEEDIPKKGDKYKDYIVDKIVPAKGLKNTEVYLKK